MLRFTVKSTNAYSLYAGRERDVPMRLGLGLQFRTALLTGSTPARRAAWSSSCQVPSYQRVRYLRRAHRDGQHMPVESEPASRRFVLTVPLMVATASRRAAHDRRLSPSGNAKSAQRNRSVQRDDQPNIRREECGNTDSDVRDFGKLRLGPVCTPSKTTTTLAPGATDSISLSFSTPATPAVAGPCA